jgi:hypothetical protein
MGSGHLEFNSVIADLVAGAIDAVDGKVLMDIE